MKLTLKEKVCNAVEDVCRIFDKRWGNPDEQIIVLVRSGNELAYAAHAIGRDLIPWLERYIKELKASQE